VKNTSILLISNELHVPYRLNTQTSVFYKNLYIKLSRGTYVFWLTLSVVNIWELLERFASCCPIRFARSVKGKAFLHRNTLKHYCRSLTRRFAPLAVCKHPYDLRYVY